MKTSRWSIAGIIVGIMFIFTSVARYLFVYPDPDRFIAYTFIGVLICAVSWLYNENKQIWNSITAIEDYLDELNNWRKENGRR